VRLLNIGASGRDNRPAVVGDANIGVCSSDRAGFVARVFAGIPVSLVPGQFLTGGRLGSLGVKGG
jgi:hypothetical protein